MRHIYLNALHLNPTLKALPYNIIPICFIHLHCHHRRTHSSTQHLTSKPKWLHLKCYTCIGGCLCVYRQELWDILLDCIQLWPSICTEFWLVWWGYGAAFNVVFYRKCQRLSTLNNAISIIPHSLLRYRVRRFIHGSVFNANMGC